VAVAAIDWHWHYRWGGDGVLPIGLMFSLIIAAILVFTAWKGGDLVYRHRVGVDPTASD